VSRGLVAGDICEHMFDSRRLIGREGNEGSTHVSADLAACGGTFVEQLAPTRTAHAPPRERFRGRSSARIALSPGYEHSPPTLAIYPIQSQSLRPGPLPHPTTTQSRRQESEPAASFRAGLYGRAYLRVIRVLGVFRGLGAGPRRTAEVPYGRSASSWPRSASGV
jgi:hypothetical protein